MDLQLGREIQVSVNPELQVTSDTARERFSPEERGCYFQGELELSHLETYRYSLENCLYSQTVSRVIHTCHCVPFHLLNNISLPICQQTNLLCMNNVITAATAKQAGLCMAACEDQILNMEVTSSTFPNRETFRKREEQCLLLKKLRLLCSDSRRITLSKTYPWICTNVSQSYSPCEPWAESSNDTRNEALLEHQLFRYARDNLAVVNIYIKVSVVLRIESSRELAQDPFVSRILRDQKVSRIQFVANTGGLLGLCTGFSLVTFCEIIYQVRPDKTTSRSAERCSRSPGGFKDTLVSSSARLRFTRRTSDNPSGGGKH